MKKVAIFVEGLTEQELVVGLLSALVGQRGVNVLLGRQWKGKVIVQPSTPDPSCAFFAFVVDCANDEQVKTQIREQYPSLVASGYTAIIGLRDVYPSPRSDLASIYAGLGKGLPIGEVAPEMHLAVMEVEAWFLAEVTHFARLHHTLSASFIVAAGFDVVGTAGDAWDHPAEVLDSIYKLANLRYMTARGAKSKKRVQRTLRALSLDELYVRVRPRIPAFDGFISNLESALF
jgi:hypothetical protein